jgi:hypothetical protein
LVDHSDDSPIHAERAASAPSVAISGSVSSRLSGRSSAIPASAAKSSVLHLHELGKNPPSALAIATIVTARPAPTAAACRGGKRTPVSVPR